MVPVSIKSYIFIFTLLCLFSCNDLEDHSLKCLTENENLENKVDISNIDNDKVMMTLSAIILRKQSYLPCLRDTISAYLERPDLETKGEWELVWFDQGSNRVKDRSSVCIVKHKKLENTLAIVSKGINLFSITEWANAFNIFQTSKHPYLPKGENAFISKGLKNVLNAFQDLKSSNDLIPNVELSAFEYLNLYCKNHMGEKVNIYLTGHSMGGVVSTCIAPKVISILEKNANFGSNLSVWTYAEPSLYNEGFVEYFKSLFNHKNINFSYKRIFLPKDPFPTQCAWKLDRPSEINYPMSFSVSSKLELSFRLSKTMLKFRKISYQSIGKEGDNFVYKIPKNVVDKVHFGVPEVINTLADLAKYTAWHHSTDSYILSLGAKCVPLETKGNRYKINMGKN